VASIREVAQYASPRLVLEKMSGAGTQYIAGVFGKLWKASSSKLSAAIGAVSVNSLLILLLYINHNSHLSYLVITTSGFILRIGDSYMELEPELIKVWTLIAAPKVIVITFTIRNDTTRREIFTALIAIACVIADLNILSSCACTVPLTTVISDRGILNVPARTL
jgi:hypothetical protein